jgi:hypothetical protein
MYFDNERTPTVKMAQGAFLSTNPNDITSSVNQTEFMSLYNDLTILSRALTEGNKEDVGLFGSRSLITLSRISQSVITDEEATYIGGDKLVGIIQAMRDVESGEGNEITRLKQVVTMLRKVSPNGK